MDPMCGSKLVPFAKILWSATHYFILLRSNKTNTMHFIVLLAVNVFLNFKKILHTMIYVKSTSDLLLKYGIVTLVRSVIDRL
jgi:hypothetical protein